MATTSPEEFRNAEIDRAIAVLLGRTQAFPILAGRVQQMLSSVYPELKATDDDVIRGLEMLKGLSYVTEAPSAIGGPSRWKLSPEGVLALRRGDFA